MVAEDAGVIVYGVFSPDAVKNDGMVMVGGVANIDLDDLDDFGHLAVSPGTLLGSDGMQVQTDGSLIASRDATTT